MQRLIGGSAQKRDASVSLTGRALEGKVCYYLVSIGERDSSDRRCAIRVRCVGANSTRSRARCSKPLARSAAHLESASTLVADSTTETAPEVRLRWYSTDGSEPRGG
jgi:hypothetical protein